MIAQKVLNLYEAITARFYKAPRDLQINGQAFNSTVLFELIAHLLQLNTLLMGDYGQGKTTSAELVSAIMSGLPYPVVVACEVRGSPEVTEEKILGRLDLGKLHQGTEHVIWSSFVKSPVHIVDELTRIPEVKQSIILEGIRTGRWLYLNQMLETGPTPLFATANFEDLSGGSFQLTPALMDRFAVALDAQYPGVEAALELAIGDDFERKVTEAGLTERAQEAIELLSGPHDPESVQTFTEEFKESLEATGLTPLYDHELTEAREAIRTVPLSTEAKRFMGFLTSLMNYCPHTRQKRSGGFGESNGSHGCCSDDCRFAGTACSRLIDGGSRRQERDAVQVARALAWVLEHEEVRPEHIRTAAPFCIWHRRQFNENFISQISGQERIHPVKLEAAHRFVDEVYREFEEQHDVLEHVHERQAELRGADNMQIMNQTGVGRKQLHPYLQDFLEAETTA